MDRNGKLVIVVDMQVDFTTGALHNEHATEIVKPMAQYIKQREKEGAIVVFTRDTHDERYMSTNEGRHLPYPHCLKGTEGHKVVQELLDASKNKFQVDKPTFGMSQDRWREVAYEHFYLLSDVKEIELVGTCTDICVVSNALSLKALFPEADVRVYSNLCAGLTAEKHNAALEVMRSCQIEVTDYE